MNDHTSTSTLSAVVTAKNETLVTWLDARHELPDDEQEVLLATEDGEVLAGYHEMDRWWHSTAVPLRSRVTHWSAYPDPPASRDDPNQGDFWKS